MILIVDSGSTKTDWIALDKNGDELFSTQTLGLNPQMLSNEILNERIKNNFDIYKNRKNVEKLFFYGAGCGVESTQNRILKVFKSIFTKSDFDIKEDTYAAVYSAVDEGTPLLLILLVLVLIALTMTVKMSFKKLTHLVMCSWIMQAVTIMVNIL